MIQIIFNSMTALMRNFFQKCACTEAQQFDLFDILF